MVLGFGVELNLSSILNKFICLSVSSLDIYIQIYVYFCFDLYIYRNIHVDR